MSWVFIKIGSNSFLEPKSLLALVVPLMLATSVVSSDSSNPVNYLYWMIANVLSLSLVAIPILLLRWVWLERSPDFVIPTPVVILASLAISFVKSLLTVLMVSEIARIPLSDLNLISRVIGGSMAGATAILASSAIVLLLREFQAERALLLTAKTMDLVPAVTNSESKKLSQLAKGISSVSRNLEDKAGASRMELAILRELVDKYVRPLSSSLYSDLDRNYQSFTARELLRSSLIQSPPALALALQYLIATPRTIEWFGIQAGLSITIIGAVLIYISLSVVAKILIRVHLWGPTSFILTSAGLPLAIGLGLAGIFSPGHDYAFPISLIMILWFGQGSIIFSMAGVALKSASRVRREVSELVQVSDAETALALLGRNRKLMANQMHGEVQSRLMNLVLRSEAGNELERKVVIEELAAIQDLISSVRNQKHSFNKSLAELAQTWEGFAMLTIRLSGFKVAPERQELVFALIEEGVSNAIRHGLASEIVIRFEKPNNLIIEDNGMGPTKGKPGLGSRLMSAGGNWSLTAREEGGARLSIELNLE